MKTPGIADAAIIFSFPSKGKAGVWMGRRDRKESHPHPTLPWKRRA
jgi:hypothetical protein